MKTVWYLHGANATAKSFAFIEPRLPEHKAILANYDTGPVAPVVSSLAAQIAQSGPCSIIGHSLGGLLAVAISQRCPNVERVVTLAAPFGGCISAVAMRFFVLPGSIFNDITPSSQFLTDLRHEGAAAPTRCIVTTAGGTSLIPDANDGVVTVRSQMVLKGAEPFVHQSNHFEVLLDKEVCDLIEDFIW